MGALCISCRRKAEPAVCKVMPAMGDLRRFASGRSNWEIDICSRASDKLCPLWPAADAKQTDGSREEFRAPGRRAKVPEEGTRGPLLDLYLNRWRPPAQRVRSPARFYLSATRARSGHRFSAWWQTFRFAPIETLATGGSIPDSRRSIFDQSLTRGFKWRSALGEKSERGERRPKDLGSPPIRPRWPAQNTRVARPR